MYSVLSYNGNEKKFDLLRHKVFSKGLTNDEAQKIVDQLSNDLEFEVIKNTVEIIDHDKHCCCGKYQSLQKRINRIQNAKFYCHQIGQPVYILMIRVINKVPSDNIIGIKVLENEDFIIVDYCYTKEALDLLCQRYQKLEDSGKVLLKVMTKEHPLDIISAR